ncbi:hypothetical protein ROS9278_05144 [Roseomonas sp. CECT 9278]|nr:hypothetical protein ROS9278_05144 [Roseomonas sp. CECT 9278]
MPRAQRMRWPMWIISRSVARPAASGTRRYAVFQPSRCIFSEAWQSSVTVSVGTPPACSMALRRSTAQEPQKKVAFHRSLPGCTRP